MSLIDVGDKNDFEQIKDMKTMVKIIDKQWLKILFLSCFFFTLSLIFSSYNGISNHVYKSTYITAPLESNNRMKVLLNTKRNAVTTDTSNGPRKVKLVKLEGGSGLDFLAMEQLRLKVEKDGTTILDQSISEFVVIDRTLKPNVAIINEWYEDFAKLIISVYDKKEKTDFRVILTLYVD